MLQTNLVGQFVNFKVGPSEEPCFGVIRGVFIRAEPGIRTYLRYIVEVDGELEECTGQEFSISEEHI